MQNSRSLVVVAVAVRQLNGRIWLVDVMHSLTEVELGLRHKVVARFVLDSQKEHSSGFGLMDC